MKRNFNPDISIVLSIVTLWEVIENTTLDIRLSEMLDKHKELKAEFSRYLSDELTGRK